MYRFLEKGGNREKIEGIRYLRKEREKA